MQARFGLLTSIIPLIAVQIGCSGSPAGVEADGVYQGTLYTAIGSGPDQQRAERFVLVTEAGPFPIVTDGEEARRALRGHAREQVAIRAERDGERLRFRAFDDGSADGTGRIEQADTATPQSGNWRFIVLACHFSDQPAVSASRAASVAAAIGDDVYPGVSHFYRSASRNAFNTGNPVAHPAVIQLSAPSSDARYWSTDGSGNRTLDWYWAVPQECMAIARTQGVDFGAYRAVAFVLDDGLLGWTAWGGGYSDGLSAVWLDTVNHSPSTLIHEIGHGLGLNHLGTWADPFYYGPYNRRGDYWCNYSSVFDPMGGGGCADRNNPACYGAQFAAFHKEALGWLGGQTLTAPKGRSQYFISRGDSAAGGLAMVRVPTFGSRSFTVEARRRNGTSFDGTTGYDQVIPSEGVLLHHMEPWSGYWEAVLIDPDQNCDSTDASAVWTVNETFSDASGFSMTVTGAQTDGYQVSIWRPYTLSLNVGMAGYVVAESVGKKQVCKPSSSCELSFPNNAAVTLTAVGTAGSFSGWSGCPQPAGSTCTFTQGAADRTIGASFTCWAGTSCASAVTSSVSITKSGSGQGRVLGSHLDCGAQCSTAVTYLDVVQLMAIPAAGSSFVRWEGSCTGSATTCDVVAAGAKSVRAVFEVPVTLTVAKDGTGAGTVADTSGAGIYCGSTCAASYWLGSSVTLRATAAAGAAFVGWSVAGCGTSATCTVTMDVAKTVRATFSLVPTNLTATPGPGRVNLAWSPVSGATNYHVFSGTSPGVYSWSWYTGGAASSTDWADFATLYYVVKAVLPSGETPASAEVSARGWSNLSRGKAASQQSDWSSTLGQPGLALDGNYDGDFNHGSVTTTNWGDQQWWQVDLGASRTLKQIDIYNRLDCCSAALSNFDVYTSNDGATWTLRSHYPGQAGSPTKLSLGSVAGRYVRIQLASYATALMLAEVDVWGY